MRSYKIILAIFIIFGASTVSVYSQNKVIKGRIISDFLETMPNVSIIINDSVVISKTDLDGFFIVSIPVSITKISFKSVGLEPTNIKLIDNCSEVEVVMMLSGTYDFATPKKVKRIRKKKFEKLPELHKKAFKEGIFKMENACYVQEFNCSYTE